MLRNLIATGNPLPALHLGIGPLALPRTPVPVIDNFGFSVAHYAGEGAFWSDVVHPGMKEALGSPWLLILLGAAIGAALCIVRARTPVERLLGVGAALAGVVYLVTPLSASGPPPIDGAFSPASTILFSVVLRYLLPSLLLGVLGLALIAGDGPTSRIVLLGFFAVTTFVVQSSDGTILTGWPDSHRIPGVVVGALAIAACLGWLRVRRTSLAPALVAATLVAVTIVGYPVARASMDARYDRDTSSLAAVYRWGQTLHDTRIGVVGLPAQYPLYGRDLSNTVRYVARLAPHGELQRIDNAREFLSAVRAGQYDYVVTQAYNLDAYFDSTQFRSEESEWLAADPGAHLVFESGDAKVFAIDPDCVQGWNEWGDQSGACVDPLGRSQGWA